MEPYSKNGNNIHSKKDFPKKRTKKSEFKWAPKKFDAAFTSLGMFSFLTKLKASLISVYIKTSIQHLTVQSLKLIFF